MSQKDLWQAIESRDLSGMMDQLCDHLKAAGVIRETKVDTGVGEATLITYHPQCSDCNDTQRVERNIDGCDVEVECVMCSPQYGLRARLSLEQRDSQERCGANTWQDRDADEYGVNRTGPI